MLILEFGFGLMQVWLCIEVFHRQRRMKDDGLNFEGVAQLLNVYVCYLKN